LAKRAAPATVGRVISLDAAENQSSSSEGPDSVREKLANYTGVVPWSYLAPHAVKGTLYFVDPALTLEEVGTTFSENHAEQVAVWLKSADLVKIEALHAAQWENGETEFEALVVTPFVLCRPV
jgi:hypothetical protein